MNEAAMRNEGRKEAEIEYLSSGIRVLEKVTRHMSVFTRDDLMRAVKCIPDKEAAERLVEDAISDKSIIPLYREEGSKTRYFTTASIRDEENRILRLSGYVANLENVISGGGKIKQVANDLISDARGDLTEEQHKALGEILLSESGLRIVRGRAGTGKSHVLGKANRIATMSGVNVIGLSPTHKAKLGLAECGYGRVDTVKGMLFKLANGRFDLPKHSLLVVDEAGMVGNDDYRELLRVAATRKCNVILAGDERQLASVQRGGMFEVFAREYGSSTILDIKRQADQWGKSVAMSMSEGRVESAISILERENRINWDDNAHASMESLIKDWNGSEYSIGDRLILAVKNSDVAATNHGVRQYLKLSGDLTGEEFAVAGNHYMRGDRILITKTSKEMGLINGDLAEITHASRGKFTIRLRDNTAIDSGEAGFREISFNPSEYSGFRHGYATTIFKAQGASIRDVYVYHNGFAGIRNSYVAMSRMVKELKLYVNRESTANVQSLARQLSHDAEAGSSLSYLTESELESRELNSGLENDSRAYVRGINRFIDFIGNTAMKLADKYIPASEYYNYQAPKEKLESVSRVIDRVYEEKEGFIANVDAIEERLAVGGERLSVSGGAGYLHDKGVRTSNALADTVASGGNIYKTRQSAKERFYANADYVRSRKQSVIFNISKEDMREVWDNESRLLRREAAYKAESIVCDLLGEPNRRLSSRRELRFGAHGRIAVRISGERSGTWYDFSAEKGGDMFDLVQERRKCDFKGAAEYLRSAVGMDKSVNTRAHLQLVHDHENSDLTAEYIKDKETRIKYANKLYDKSKPLGEYSTGVRYLREYRSISCTLGKDIKTTGIYDVEKKEYLPALIAFARDGQGNVTGGQHLVLNKDSGYKADVAVPKKSFGRIAGSFVDLGNIKGETNTDNIEDSSRVESGITIIAEGLETGLSVKQGLREHRRKEVSFKTLCSLGISNIRNYEPYQGERIIIAADNDGIESRTNQTIENARLALKEKGAYVEVVRPVLEGDFNDVLKSEGSRTVFEAFEPAISKHNAKTLSEYFSSKNQTFTLSHEERKDINYLSRFNINEESIVDAYRLDPVKGREELNRILEPIKFTHKHVKLNMHTIDSANIYGANINRKELVISLLGKGEEEIDRHILLLREKYYIKDSINDLVNNRKQAKTPAKAMEALQAHQEFLAKLYNNHAPDIHGKQLEKEIKIAHYNKQHGIDNQLEKLTTRIVHTAMNQEKIISALKHSRNSSTALNTLTKKYHGYVMNTIHSTIKDIKAGHRMILGDKAFTCEEKFLSHMLKEHRNNDFFPGKNVQKIYNDLTRQNEISRDLHKGMSL